MRVFRDHLLVGDFVAGVHAQGTEDGGLDILAPDALWDPTTGRWKGRVLHHYAADEWHAAGDGFVCGGAAHDPSCSNCAPQRPPLPITVQPNLLEEDTQIASGRCPPGADRRVGQMALGRLSGGRQNTSKAGYQTA